MNEALNTINASKLMETALPPLKFYVDGLIPQGVHLIVGIPRVGRLVCLDAFTSPPVPQAGCSPV